MTRYNKLLRSGKSAPFDGKIKRAIRGKLDSDFVSECLSDKESDYKNEEELEELIVRYYLFEEEDVFEDMCNAYSWLNDIRYLFDDAN